MNEVCRKSDFNGIDFENSFMFGDSRFEIKNGTNRGCGPANPSSCDNDDVVYNCMTSDFDSMRCGESCPMHPEAVEAEIPAYNDRTRDSWQWNIPFDTCGINAELYDDGSKLYYHYDLFFNSHSAGYNIDNGANDILQMGQVRFRCKMDPYQEDTGEVYVEEDAMIDDQEFKLRLFDYLE